MAHDAEKERDLNSLSTPYNRALHLFASCTAFVTFLLIVAGALVTSHDAGLSVPDWPTSFGHSPVSYSYFKVPLVGGVRYEHGHRIIAEFLGLLTIALAVWTWRSDRRAWMRKLGLAALATVIIQGVFGGLTVLTGLPPVVSSIHALLGQTFFCIAVAIALFTGRRWVAEEPRAQFDSRRPALPYLAWLAVAAVCVQLFLGAMFRHHGMRLLPHLVTAIIVTVIVLWTVMRALTQYRDVDQLRRPALMLAGLLVAQLALGFAAYLTRVLWDANAVASQAAMVASTVAHVSVGALVLATTVVLAIQSKRHVPIPAGELAPGARKAVTA